MRELNPRAWIPSLNRYATGYDSIYYHRQTNKEEGEWWCYPAGKIIQLDVEIELPTGLKDKNGKEIYEGDIVEALIDGMWSTGRNTVSFGKAKWRLEVLFDDIRFMDVFHVIGSKNCPDRIYYLFDKELSDIKVIGNIHENPELLEDKK